MFVSGIWMIEEIRMSHHKSEPSVHNFITEYLGNCYYHFTKNSLLSLPVKEFWELLKSWCSYEQNGGLLWPLCIDVVITKISSLVWLLISRWKVVQCTLSDRENSVCKILYSMRSFDLNQCRYFETPDGLKSITFLTSLGLCSSVASLRSGMIFYHCIVNSQLSVPMKKCRKFVNI